MRIHTPGYYPDDMVENYCDIMRRYSTKLFKFGPFSPFYDKKIPLTVHTVDAFIWSIDSSFEKSLTDKNKNKNEDMVIKLRKKDMCFFCKRRAVFLSPMIKDFYGIWDINRYNTHDNIQRVYDYNVFLFDKNKKYFNRHSFIFQNNDCSTCDEEQSLLWKMY